MMLVENLMVYKLPKILNRLTILKNIIKHYVCYKGEPLNEETRFKCI